MYRFEIFKDKAGEYRFRLVAPNGEIMFASEGYTAKRSCIDTVLSIQENAAEAVIVQLG